MNTPLVRYALVVWVVVQLLMHFTLVAFPAIQAGATGFGAYYTASWLMVRGEFTPQAYDNDWFGDQMPIAMQEPNARDIIAPNLPTVGFALLPLLPFPPAQARTLYLIASWLAGWVALGIVVWQTRPRAEGKAPVGWIIGGLLVAWSAPFIFNLQIGQIYAFLFLALVLVWVLLLHGKNVGAGLILGLAFMLKSAGALLFFVPLLYRRWGLWLGAGVVMAGLGLASFLYISPQTWLAYVETVQGSSHHPTQGVTAYQTTLGFLSHFLRYEATWNLAPIVDIPWVVRPLYLAVTLIAVATTCWRLFRTRESLSVGICLLLILSVISVPFAEEYHFIVLCLPLGVIAQKVWNERGRKRMTGAALLTIAAAMLLLPLPFEHPRLSVGWWALLAYPRLYGAWLLWGVGVGVLRSED